MNRKLGEAGKITGTAILAIVIVGIVAYLGYGWYQQKKNASGSGITWTAILENGDEIPIESTTTLYASQWGPLALYSDPGHTTKITGVKGHVWVTANTEATGFGDATLSGSYYPCVITPNSDTVVYSPNIVNWPGTQTIKLNTKTEITAWALTWPSSQMVGQPTGSYKIGVKQIVTGTATNLSNNTSISGTQTIESSITVYWTKDTLTIVPELNWTTYSLV